MRERGEEERKKEEREKRNQKRKGVELVFPRTCFHGLLVTPRPPTAPRPLTVMASAFRASRQPPLSQNPAYAPGSRVCLKGQLFDFLKDTHREGEMAEKKKKQRRRRAGNEAGV